jgi:hypothetical protein
MLLITFVLGYTTEMPAQTNPDLTLFTSQADTSMLVVMRQEALLTRTRIDFDKTGWRRLLPSAQINFTATSRNLAFIPLQTTTFQDPLLRQWPTDTWTLSLAWRINDLFDFSLRKKATTNLRLAELNLEIARHRRQEAIVHVERSRDKTKLVAWADYDHFEDQLVLLRRELGLRQDLLELAEMKYEQADLSFEALQSQRLALVQTERRILDTRFALQNAWLRGGGLISPDVPLRVAATANLLP